MRLISRHEDAVARKIQERAEHGLQKYGVSVERTDLSTLDWLRHAQEESMDLSVYLERLIQIEEAKVRGEIPPGPGAHTQQFDPTPGGGSHSHTYHFAGSCEGCPYPDTCSYYRRCVFRRGGNR